MVLVKLKSELDNIYRIYHKAEYLGLDPLIVVREYEASPDLEIVALVSACLSYGRVETIISSIRKVLTITGPEIGKFVRTTSFIEKKNSFSSFKHRFNDGVDVALLFDAIGHVINQFGSLEAAFSHGLRATDADIGNALSAFTSQIKHQAEITLGSRRKSFEYFLPSPAKGSSCKRMNMFLRWMVRENDGIDLGVWSKVSPAKLVIPVDAHVDRAARRMRLTKRKTPDWRMAVEITHMLRRICPEDPVKYDFAICHAGKLEHRGSGKL